MGVVPTSKQPGSTSAPPRAELSLRDALAAVTFDNVLQSLLITHHALLSLLGRAPHIGVAALNPHAGEGGLFGLAHEFIDIDNPA